jgi:hypothetical protein
MVADAAFPCMRKMPTGNARGRELTAREAGFRHLVVLTAAA